MKCVLNIKVIYYASELTYISDSTRRKYNKVQMHELKCLENLEKILWRDELAVTWRGSLGCRILQGSFVDGLEIYKEIGKWKY